MGFFYSQLFVNPTIPSNTTFTGQTVIVTGSNTGLGKEAARHVARLGASRIILAVRNTKAGEAARSDILSTTQRTPDTIEVWSLDLASYDSVKAFAKRASQLPRIDVLLENAGIAATEFSLAEGHERSITINVISTFLLAFLLLPKLKQTAKDHGTAPHLCIVSSEVHAWAKFPEWKKDRIFETLDTEGKSNFSERYQVSKLLEVLVIREIAPQLAGSGVILNYLNPGLCHSELSRDAGIGLAVLKAVLARPTEKGSRTLVAAAVGGKESHGKYMSDAKVDEAALSSFVRSKDGKTAGTKVWGELKEILNQIQPNVTANL